MDRYHLKNIIILILTLVNLFLLGSLAQRRSAENATYQNTVQQITALFAAEGITLNVDSIPSELPPASRTLNRSIELDRKAAAYLLGDEVTQIDQGGGIFTYDGKNGGALFRANGNFDAAGTLTAKNADSFCRSFCREFGYSDPLYQLDEYGNGTAVATRLWNRLPIFNCTVTFTLVEDVVVSVSGTLLPDLSTEVEPSVPPLSALAALTAFQQTRKETGAVVTSISDIYLCYELQSPIAAPLSLTPAWCIDTNTAKYYVNAITGSVHLL